MQDFPSSLNASSLPVLCVLGPTASGKTGLAIDLRGIFDFDIVSVDSALVYKRMDIGTAKPDLATLADSPHALIDLIEPWQQYSVALFVEDAIAEINAIHKKGRIPILVGGTMMYFHALWNGLSSLPAADPAVRFRLETEAGEQGLAYLYTRLKSIDPNSAMRIDQNDPQRVLRALEVFELTGKTLTELQNQRANSGGFDFYNVGLFPDNRAALHKNIEDRFGLMLEMGFIEEVTSLLAEPQMHTGLSSMRCVGYRQACAYLEDKYTLAEMTDKAIAATRQLAKRQLTWMRKMQHIKRFDLGLSTEMLLSDGGFIKWCKRHRIAQYGS